MPISHRVNNHFELKVINTKKTMAKKSTAAEDFMKSRLNAGKKRVPAANFTGAKRKAAAPIFAKKRN